MRSIKKQLSWWRIVLIIGVAAVGITIAARVSPTSIEVVEERPDYRVQQTTAGNEDADAKDSMDSKAAVGKVVVPQRDYRDRRREYWEKRVERRLDAREEYLNDQTADDNDADPRDNRAANDNDPAEDENGEDDPVDRDVRSRQDVYERRRDAWRQRVEREW